MRLLEGSEGLGTGGGISSERLPLVVSASCLQIGPALAVIAFTAVAANLIAISGGILVRHDSIAAGAP
ncbi:MAG TPA: hypothetical protein VFB39_15445 [Solirubrobacteraceae bacterium]|nr:hypothetical protein [Solirubrobacteraceae bacterium]